MPSARAAVLIAAAAFGIASAESGAQSGNTGRTEPEPAPAAAHEVPAAGPAPTVADGKAELAPVMIAGSRLDDVQQTTSAARHHVQPLEQESIP